MRPRTPQSVGGFTLIEIAIVVAVMTILLTLGLSLMNAQLSSTAYSVTKKRQEAIKDALIAYLGTHKRLPCPDAPNNTNGTTDTSGVTGEEDRQGGIPTGACSPSSFGVVPFRTLGLSREIALDGWSNFFSYQVYTILGGAVCPGTDNDWSLTNCFGAGKTGGISVRDGMVNANPPLTSNAIAVVISHGANGLGAWASQATQPNVTPPVMLTTCEERRNANVDTSDCPPPAAPYTYFKGERQDQDDVVLSLDAMEAINAISKQGNVKTAVAQVNEDLQMIRDSVLGTIVSIGCGPPSPISISITPSLYDPNGMRLDPWGNPYKPLSLPITITKPSGATDVCIYSHGPNGSSGPNAGSVNPTCVPTNGAISAFIRNPVLVNSLTNANWPNC